MIQQLINLIQAQIGFTDHSPDALERGLIPFATMKQVRKIIILLRECGVPEEWRLWVTGQLVGRQLRSSKDLSMYEASAIIEVLTVGPDGRGDGERACEWAREATGEMLEDVLKYALSRKVKREGGSQRVEVVQQLGFC